MMFLLLTILSFIRFLYAFEPACTTCKFFIPHKSSPDLGLCNVFKEKIVNNVFMLKNFADHCRNDENLCGKSGFLYEPINEFEVNDNLLTEKREIISNLCCGELNEQKDIEELEQLEKDFIDIYQKMRSHNTKRIIKTTKDLYKLFKKK